MVTSKDIITAGNVVFARIEDARKSMSSLIDGIRIKHAEHRLRFTTEISFWGTAYDNIEPHWPLQDEIVRQIWVDLMFLRDLHKQFYRLEGPSGYERHFNHGYLDMLAAVPRLHSLATMNTSVQIGTNFQDPAYEVKFLNGDDWYLQLEAIRKNGVWYEETSIYRV